MIRSFKDKTTADIFHGLNTKAARKVPVEIHTRTKLLLEFLNATSSPMDMTTVPGTRLEKLKGSLAGFYSVRVNNQWRIVFRFLDGKAYDVQVIDYH